MAVYVRQGQMIGFGGKYNCHYGIACHFGNPVDLNKVLEWEIERLRKGIPSKIHITGRPYKAFYEEYAKLKRGLITITSTCKTCEGKGWYVIEKQQIKHYSGVEMKAFKGYVFKETTLCDDCDRFGYREWLAKEPTK